jgi:lactoylglutathione lyase
MTRANRLTFVALSVSNLAASLEFYREVLGLPLKDESHDADLGDPWYGGPHAAYSWTDGALIHFALYPSREPHRPVSTAAQIGFHVFDFDAVHARVMRAGIEVVQNPRHEPWGTTARYVDPDGNIVSITASAA